MADKEFFETIEFNLAPVSEGLLSPDADEGEKTGDLKLRPRYFNEFIGQPEVKSQLGVMIKAARNREDALEHILFAGPPGLGKTTLAGIIASELGVGLRTTSGPALVKVGDLAAILSDLNTGDVLFIDEIHRLAKPVEELLYPAMEDFKIDIILGKGPQAGVFRMDISRFTLIGATTRVGMLSSPLRDRFGHVARLDYYGDEDLSLIVKRSAKILGVEIDDDAALEIASRARGTPRIANRLLRRVRDVAEVSNATNIDLALARNTLKFYGIDELGLDQIDRLILEALCVKFNAKPTGLNTLASYIGEEKETIESVYEPFLIKKGLIQKTPRGRVPTAAAYSHLNIKKSDRLQLDL